MKAYTSKRIILLVFLLVMTGYTCRVYPKAIAKGVLYGNISLDETWSPVVFLSYIPTFDDMYLMSNDAIISKANIDSLGNFSFDISYLPEKDNLFRLHIIKKGDVPNTLIIGGNNENHLFLLANCYSTIEINCKNILPPFKNVSFGKSSSNIAFSEITNLIVTAENKANESGNAKRRLIENKLHDKLRFIADTCSNPLISLYAIYNSGFETNYNSNVGYYESYLDRWSNQKDSYFVAFRKEIPLPNGKSKTWIIILLSVVLISISYYYGNRTRKKERGIKKLSVQERKVFELLKTGATNQEISEECNIGLSTVKSHVSSIFVKLQIKSRKEAMNME